MKSKEMEILREEIKYGHLVSFMIKILPELTNNQLDTLVTKIGFELEDRLRRDS